MKALISLLIVGGILMGIWKIWEFYDQKTSNRQVAQSLQKRFDSSRLQGMNPNLENQYAQARDSGTLALRDFLERYRNTEFLVDPRLAAIEMDYIWLLRAKDPAEAKRLLSVLKARIKPGTPILSEMLNELELSFK